MGRAAVPAALALAMGGAAPLRADDLTVSYVNTVPLGAQAVDHLGQSFTVTGLSGLSYMGFSVYAAAMDNSDKLVFVEVLLGAGGAITQASITGATRLAVPRDFEDVAVTGLSTTAFLCEEGTPAVLEFSQTTGALLRSLPVPPIFATRRDNFGFESLTRSADGLVLWTANEEALTVDGPASTPANGTRVRLLRYDLAGGAPPAAQFGYLTQPMHAGDISGGRSGLVSLVLLPSGRMIAMERSLANNIFRFFETRIYEITFDGATDVSALASLTLPHTPAAKRLLYSGSHTNIEGLCLGPRQPDGSYALLGIVDDGDPISVNRVVAFRLTGPVEPAPCPADFNADGFVDFFDADAFVACFEGAECPPGRTADFNGDGFADFFDADAFVVAFEAGC